MLQMLKTCDFRFNKKKSYSISFYFNLDFDSILSVILSPKKLHGPLTIRMHCN